jgi:hypothetical protein
MRTDHSLQENGISYHRIRNKPWKIGEIASRAGIYNNSTHFSLLLYTLVEHYLDIHSADKSTDIILLLEYNSNGQAGHS